MIKGVIFDVDNTLTDFMRAKRMAVDAGVEMMIDAGLKADKDAFVQKIFDIYWKEGVEDQKIFDKVLTKEFGRIDVKILAAGIVGYRRAKNGSQVLYPHASVTLFELLKMGIKSVVLSDAPKLEVWLRLANLGIHNYFDHVIASEDYGVRKPHAVPFQKAMEVLGTKPEETVMIGDWPERDIVGAKKIGLKTAWARYGDTFGTKPKESGADYELTDILELVDVIKKENGLA
ncbi:MAG: HAD-IA family hydrolase [Elusimicrobia bacterium]|nr:HAD-IA family hydrolase [Elusimicrobiota bacterium]